MAESPREIAGEQPIANRHGIALAAHPLLELRVFRACFAPSLSAFAAQRLLEREPPAGLSAPDDAVRAAIRDLLRHGGFKPTGRSKPSSEYLARAHGEGGIRPINLAVDAGNFVSLHSGLPISVVDVHKLQGPLGVAVAPADASFVFNPAGQVIDVGHLLCLHDAEGPCANAVKDAQRTKTDEDTRETLILIWGCRALAARVDAALSVHRQLLESAGARLEDVPVLAT